MEPSESVMKTQASLVPVLTPAKRCSNQRGVEELSGARTRLADREKRRSGSNRPSTSRGKWAQTCTRIGPSCSSRL